jgi:uracil-DNA glycosylase family 4
MADRTSSIRRLAVLERKVVHCTRCPELRAYCAEIATTKRRAFQDWEYWGRPVPGFGDPAAGVVIVGLAPAAHGANRTGRMFTGDRSGDFLYGALHRVGLANQPNSRHRDDGLELDGVFITAALRCAPPGNRPTADQLASCTPYLRDELRSLSPAVIVTLGAIAWNATLSVLRGLGTSIPRPKPRFAHGAEIALGTTTVLACYHVSQQNTFTGRLTEPMIDAVLERAKAVVGVR